MKILLANINVIYRHISDLRPNDETIAAQLK